MGLASLFNGPLAHGWPKAANTGPGFEGKTPVQVMYEGGIPAMMRVRQQERGVIRAADLPVREVVEPATVRLVTAGYVDKPAMALLADDPSERAILEEIEGLISSLSPSSWTVPAGIQPGELLTEVDGYGWNYVNAAFCHTRPHG